MRSHKVKIDGVETVLTFEVGRAVGIEAQVKYTTAEEVVVRFEELMAAKPDGGN